MRIGAAIGEKTGAVPRPGRSSPLPPDEPGDDGDAASVDAAMARMSMRPEPSVCELAKPGARLRRASTTCRRTAAARRQRLQVVEREEHRVFVALAGHRPHVDAARRLLRPAPPAAPRNRATRCASDAAPAPPTARRTARRHRHRRRTRPPFRGRRRRRRVAPGAAAPPNRSPAGASDRRFIAATGGGEQIGRVGASRRAFVARGRGAAEIAEVFDRVRAAANRRSLRARRRSRRRSRRRRIRPHFGTATAGRPARDRSRGATPHRRSPLPREGPPPACRRRAPRSSAGSSPGKPTRRPPALRRATTLHAAVGAATNDDDVAALLAADLEDLPANLLVRDRVLRRAVIANDLHGAPSCE